MNWQTIQQVVRIGAQWASGALVTNGIIDGSMEQMTTGVIAGGAALVWWIVWERRRPNPTPPTV